MSDKILEVINLVTTFRNETEIIKAVDTVSFDLYKGETLGIVGESGSGKSVTSLSIMRLIPPPGKINNGTINFFSPYNPTFSESEKTQSISEKKVFSRNPSSPPVIDLLSIPEKEIRHYRGNRIAMIFQEPMTSLNPVFTCGSQVVEAIVLHQKISSLLAKKQTLELFERVKLPEPKRIFNSYPHQLSGGQKQRVMIAMAMSCNPDILIADEPTTALDVTVQATILDLMKQLQNENNMSLIFISHDLGVMAEIADRILVMYKGKIVEQGKVLDIFTNPQHPYTKGLLACRPPLGKRLKILPIISDFMSEDENGNLKEIANSISKVIEAKVISENETKQRYDGLVSKKPFLSVQNLKVYFPSKKSFWGKTREYVKAVNNVSFDVYPGETLGLVGESGCGKTTLGRSIIRLIEPNEGKIIMNEIDLLQLSEHELKNKRKEMQIIFQDPYSSLNPRLTIGNAIMEPMQFHRLYSNDNERKEKMIELLGKVNLNSDFFNRYPHEFSGGQRQRICIARALALHPKFIICDESVSALDVSVQAQVLNLLIALREEFGFTYIFISHDLSVVNFISDRIAVMNNGNIEEIGPADEIYHHPQKDYTRKLITAIPKGNVEGIKRRIEKA